jgi:hypothetical protein
LLLLGGRLHLLLRLGLGGQPGSDSCQLLLMQLLQLLQVLPHVMLVRLAWPQRMVLLKVLKLCLLLPCLLLQLGPHLLLLRLKVWLGLGQRFGLRLACRCHSWLRRQRPCCSWQG